MPACSKSECWARNVSQFVIGCGCAAFVTLMLACTAAAFGQEDTANDGHTESVAETIPKSPAVERLAHRSYEPRLDDIRPSSFQGLTPGQTNQAEVSQRLGEPASQRLDGAQLSLTYQVGPFPRVEVCVEDGLVCGVLVQLPDPLPVAAVERELGLDAFCPALMRDSEGAIVGWTYPERGVQLLFVEGDNSFRVEQLLLERISAEAFVIRAEGDRQYRYTQQLADLKQAAKIDASYAPAHASLAETMLRIGLYEESLAAAERAVRYGDANPAYDLLHAIGKFHTGEQGEAIATLKSLLEREDLAEHVRARTEARLGDMLASPPRWQHREAIKYHMTAIQTTVPLASDPRASIRAQALQLLVETHIAAACDIAGGDWQDKPATISKWLDSAKQVVTAIERQNLGGDWLDFYVLRMSVAAYAETGEKFGDDIPFDAVLEKGQRMLATAEDPHYQRALRRQLAKLLFDGARLAVATRDDDRVRDLAQKAVAFCEQRPPEEQHSAADKDWEGRLYFLVGSLRAMEQETHDEAVRWFERALPLLTDLQPVGPSRASRRHGERFVSMGISYWEVGAREEAVKLTKDGLEIMREASQAGYISQRDLAVPYGNLATMYRAMGNMEEAKRMAVVAAKLEREGEAEER
jgi:tetratricopeptide (TPR) repeat protein